MAAAGEVVGSALRASAAQLQAHRVSTQLPPDLPLVRYDAVLIERVLANLLENAAKYTRPAPASPSARRCTAWLQVTVADDGPGLPPGRADILFEKFTRGERESAKPLGAGHLPHHRIGGQLAAIADTQNSIGTTLWPPVHSSAWPRLP
jgi:two-component system sensor histidine kinase KdpD